MERLWSAGEVRGAEDRSLWGLSGAAALYESGTLVLRNPVDDPCRQ